MNQLVSFILLVGGIALAMVLFIFQLRFGYKAQRTMAIWGFALLAYAGFRGLYPLTDSLAFVYWGALGSGAFLVLVALITFLLVEAPRLQGQLRERDETTAH